ncbi:MAG: NAD-dependent succinate-semialdehyde dehydrogenase [Prolixibacteraceae bacterium]|jgi:succinate-semialdehyde dehydrogenase/glutarate-semialdehyde dehydrogenase|nr:NAD-dependent succinate-semialdehyde dehydrogenase [Prolixibacteraceae bacterium]
MQSINPYNNQLIAEYTEMTLEETSAAVDLNYEAWQSWRNTSFKHRAKLMKKAAGVLRKNKSKLSKLITLEMGKRIAEAEAEVEKCAWVCEFYAEKAEVMLADEAIETDGQKSMAIFQPIGPVLAVMPWNYPFWQVYRFAAPALMAGNAGLLKHASNVQGCALAIEKVFVEAGFPKDIFRSLIIGSSKVKAVIANSKVRAVTLTGSEYAGSQVASAAGKYLKKSVLELGGSDPCVVLADADLNEAARVGVISRMLTTGQTCIAAKRFIVVEEVAEVFIGKMKREMEKLKAGDPLHPSTTLAPLSKRNFVDEIHKQVIDSVGQGAECLLGGEVEETGCFYPPTILTKVTPEMPVFYEETFGPVAAVITVKNEDEAIKVANDSLFGLGAAIWSKDIEKGERLARQIEAGAIFINGIVKSDPRLPFGGIKNSGYGRELSDYGIKEFCNIKSIWVK